MRTVLRTFPISGHLLSKAASDHVFRNLESLTPQDKCAYLDHLQFLKPGSKDLQDVARVSKQNLQHLFAITEKIGVDDNWTQQNERDLIERIMGLDFTLTHGSFDSSLVLNDGYLRSRTQLGFNAPGLMGKSGDKEHYYEDFIFFGLSAKAPHESITPNYKFVFPFDEELERRACIFLQDHNALQHRELFGQKSIIGTEPAKQEFLGVFRVTETDRGCFRYKFLREDESELATSDFISGQQQFFYSDDIKMAIATMGALHSRILGQKALLDLSDEEFAKTISDLSGFEARVPHSLSLDKAVHCYKKPSAKLTNAEIATKVAHAQEEKNYWSPGSYD